MEFILVITLAFGIPVLISYYSDKQITPKQLADRTINKFKHIIHRRDLPPDDKR